MLTKEHGLFTIDRFEAKPDRLTRKQHAGYFPLTLRMLEIYRTGKGLTRRELHRRIEAIFADESDAPPQRLRSFIKLLDEASEYETDGQGRAAELRQKVFALAARRHPLVRQPDRLFESGEEQVKMEIASELGQSWSQIESSMYSDFPEFHRLQSFQGYDDPAGLLRHYNIAQVQVLLFYAEHLTIDARADFKVLFRYAKLSGLLHEITVLGPSSYRIHFTGPVSILKQTRRYGVNFAKFLPALLTCRDWQMQARLSFHGRPSFLRLSSSSGLKSLYKQGKEFDSSLEEKFAAKFGPSREGWKLEHEGEILVKNQKVFVPDFVFRHEDGTVVYFEIVGFWTPEYLAAKWKTLSLFAGHPMIISVSKKQALEEEKGMPMDALTHSESLHPKIILKRLETFRQNLKRTTIHVD